MYYLRVIYYLLRGYGRDAAGAILALVATLHCLVKKFLTRHFENVGLVAAIGVLVAISMLVHQLDPTAGGLPLDALQLVATPALLVFCILHTAIWIYKNLLPAWFKYLKAESPKLFEDVIPDSFTPLLASGHHDAKMVQSILSYYRLKFTIRCVRTSFALLPLAFFVYLLYRLTVLSLTLIPN